jgi:exoribonuclease R
MEDGLDYVTITIADVSAAISEGSSLDLRAAKISQTFYQDGLAPKPMFPPLMSEGQLSLLKGSRKPGLSMKVCLDDINAGAKWFESAVNVSQTFDYESIYKDEGLVSKLKKMSAVFGLECDDSHKWVEAAMKFYNVEAAKLLKQAGLGVMRSHTGPDLERYNKLVPELAFLANVAAKYVPPFGLTRHVGLGEDAYCHVTSPIRRYADLINQRHLKQLLFAYPNNSWTPVDYDRLNTISKKAKQHDRDLVFLRALKKTGTGIVPGVIAEIREFDDLCKLSIYVDTWKLMVKIKYKKGLEKGTIISKDETITMSVSVGQSVTINYHSNLLARCWKRRIVLKLC